VDGDNHKRYRENDGNSDHYRHGVILGAHGRDCDADQGGVAAHPTFLAGWVVSTSGLRVQLCRCCFELRGLVGTL
jgi:hypothetical protein